MTKTCGIFLINSLKELLLVHPTGSAPMDNWSIPKGLPEEGESEFTTALRELKEETGIILDLNQIHKVRRNPLITYPNRKKVLYSFIVFHKQSLREIDLRCDSFFESNGKQIPENDVIQWIPLDKIPQLGLKLHVTQTMLLQQCVVLSKTGHK